MYKIGIFTDVHGNDLALLTVLKILQEQKVDELISLGDLIAIGPNSNEVLEIVTKLDKFSTVRGNHEKYYLQGFSNPLSCTEAAHQDWVKANIDVKFADFIENTPYQIEKEIEGVKLAFLHYPLRSKNPDHYEYIVHNPKPEDLDNLFKDIDADVICYGHEHVANFTQGQKLYLDAGSCGCPYPEKDIARCMVLTIDKGKLTYEQFKVTYDANKIVEDMFKKDMPEKEFISKNFYLSNK